MSLLKVLFDSNEREVRKLQKQVLAINALEPQMQSLSDTVLAGKTAEFKERLARGENLDRILPEAFAVVREASRRTIGLRHFDVQLMGGMVLHQGRISEMKTGEGKTLVATLPLYLNALLGKGVHLVTVNDYLAKRDRNWMAPIFEFLGLSVGVIQHDLSNEERRNAYLCDITYGTNNEMGFDYLRDNMVLTLQDRVLRPLYFAIVDEVDSILIDEARTPLIISGLGQESTDLYHKFARLVPRLNKTADYTVDEKAHSVPLTEEGVSKVEKMLGIENFYEHENVELTHHLTQALRAKELYKRDVHYVIKNGEIIIVDEFTGRLMFGRRYSEGLHQAIEAKEGVKVRQEDQTLATITFQNFFLLYEKLAGMTGTAATEEDEFRKIYNMDVVVIPTHREMIRKDHPDVVYRSEKGKFDAVITEIGECYEQGRPVLVGTRSIEKSEMLSGMLKRKGIPHQVLNAKYHEKEAEIIAQAGKSGTITIATNMAGRGVDILLGGNPHGVVDGVLRQRGIDPQEATPEERADALKPAESICEEDKQKVISLGGLHIMGSERHESRRIDNQLRGRSGRQGDPGSSRFYVSLEDELMRLFGSDRIAPIMERLGMDDETPIEHGLISRAIENAQKKVEAHNFDIRKSVLEYDNVMNTQRGVIYGERDKVLAGEDLKPQILVMLEHQVDHILSLHASDNVPPDEWDIRGLWEVTRELFPVPFDARMEDLSSPKVEELRRLLLQWAVKAYEEREEKLGSLTMRELERMVLLHMIDTKWIDHLSAMDALKDGIGLRAYGQKDPRLEYIAEGHAMFEEMKRSIEEDTVKYLYRVQVVEQRASRYRVTHTNRDEDGDGSPRVATVRKGQKVGRNDACPCGSGKKYKKCCGAA